MRLKFLRDPGPAEKLILNTARRQWRLVFINLSSSLLEAISEGAALAVVFMAVQVLSSAGEFNWSTNPLLGHFPVVIHWLNSIPRVPLFLLLLGVSVSMQALQCGSRYLNLLSVGYLAARCRAQITQLMHRQILSFSYDCASRYRVGDLGDLINLGPEAVRIAIEQTSQLFVNSLLIAVYIGVLMALSPWLLLMAIALALLITWVQRKLLPRIRRIAQRVSSDQQEISARILENIQGLRLLHSLGGLDSADLSVSNQMSRLENSLRRQYQLVELIGPISQFLPVLAIAVLGASSLIVFGDKSSGVLPSLVTFVLALQRLNIRLGMIAKVFTDLSSNVGRLVRLDSLLARESKTFRRTGGSVYTCLRHSIGFRNVSLRYRKDGAYALQHVSFEIPKGSTVALVGPSGAGKSSIADLLTGLYEPTSGSIVIDSTELGCLDLSSWQKKLGIVSQETFLFNASIAENIRYGSPGATDSKVQEAAEAAQAHGFILGLPNGYSTIIGERGHQLSGGQRQRLSLARAILRQPDLLILDEATSALDSESERLVQTALSSLSSGITKLVIAHRLSTIINADLIVVMERGCIVQSGKHADLLADADGRYRALWAYQGGKV